MSVILRDSRQYELVHDIDVFMNRNKNEKMERAVKALFSAFFVAFIAHDRNNRSSIINNFVTLNKWPDLRTTSYVKKLKN